MKKSPPSSASMDEPSSSALRPPRFSITTIAAILAITASVHGIFALATLAGHGWHPAAFISEDALYFNRYKPMFHSEILVMESGYDAGFYYLVASNLSGGGPFRKAYFHRRILLPALMYAASLGKQARFPLSFFMVSLLSSLSAAALLAVYFGRRGISPWRALGFSLFPGVIISTLHVGVDSLSIALLLPALLLTGEGGRKFDANTAFGLIFILLAALAKETALLFSVLLFLKVFLEKRSARSFLYLLPVAVFFIWSAVVEKLLVPGGDYGTAQALTYNYSSVPLAGIVDWASAAMKSAPPFSIGFAAHFAAPAAFLAFCLFIGVSALVRLRKDRSVFYPAAAVLAIMLLFTKEPMLNLYSCLRVYLPVVICFLFMLDDWSPTLRSVWKWGFIAFVAVSDIFLLAGPAQKYFLYIPK